MMRKVILFFFVLIPLCSFAQNDRKDFYHRSKKALVYPYLNVKRYESDSIIYQDDSIRVTFEFEYVPLHGVKYLMIDIFNRTEDRIYVEWENVRLNQSKFKFIFDSSVKKDLKKEDECIFGGEASGYKFLEKDLSLTSSKIDNDKIYQRKHGETELKVRLPIRFNEGTKDYKFIFNFGKYSEVEIDSLYSLAKDMRVKMKKLKKGMTLSEVESVMGKPISESIMESNWGSSRAMKFYPHGVKKGDMILSYPFINVFIREGILAKAAEIERYD